MMRLSSIRQVLAATKRSGPLFFDPRHPVLAVSKRHFNQQTLENANKYLTENKHKIKFERNESGFIRTTFPDWVLVPDAKIAPLAKGERLRANFWYYVDSDCSMGDESIHDHPSAFQSYIVNGGYEHELYKVNCNGQEDLKFSPSLNLTKQQLWNLYQKFALSYVVPSEQSERKFKFSIDKETKKVTYEGVVLLKLTGVEATKRGDVVNIDSRMIHRVSKFHAVPGEKTLSINIVRNEGKYITNIYLPEKKGAAVKTEREKVSDEESSLAAEEMTGLFAKARM